MFHINKGMKYTPRREKSLVINGLCYCGTPIARGKRVYCRKCANLKQREWRKTHRLSGLARMKANARSFLHTYVSRGKIKKGLCEVCQSPQVHGHHDDYTKPLQVRWLCKEHHLQLHKNENKRMECREVLVNEVSSPH